MFIMYSYSQVCIYNSAAPEAQVLVVVLVLVVEIMVLVVVAVDRIGQSHAK